MSMLDLQTDQLRELAFKVQEGEVVSDAELIQALHGAAEMIEDLILKHEGKSTCTGCKHSGRFENEFENGYPCPCIICKRRTRDHYERID
jgi:hypothetical protein